MKCVENLKICQAKCCECIQLKITLPTKDLIRYYRLHNCEVNRLDRKTYEVIVPLRCNALGDDNTCRLQGINKPEVCKRFSPGHTKNCYIPPGCLIKDI